MSDISSILRGNIKFPFAISNKKRKKYSGGKIEELFFSSYIRLNVKDKYGVLSDVTKIFSNNKVSINIYNILGSKVSETKKMHLSSGNHLIMKNIDFKKGQYFVVVENELGEIISSQKLTVTN